MNTKLNTQSLTHLSSPVSNQNYEDRDFELDSFVQQRQFQESDLDFELDSLSASINQQSLPSQQRKRDVKSTGKTGMQRVTSKSGLRKGRPPVDTQTYVFSRDQKIQYWESLLPQQEKEQEKNRDYIEKYKIQIQRLKNDIGRESDKGNQKDINLIQQKEAEIRQLKIMQKKLKPAEKLKNKISAQKTRRDKKKEQDEMPIKLDKFFQLISEELSPSTRQKFVSELQKSCQRKILVPTNDDSSFLKQLCYSYFNQPS